MSKTNHLNTTSAVSVDAAQVSTKRIEPDALYSTKELYHITGTSERTYEHWRSTGEGPAYIRFGGKLVKYKGSAILAYAEARSFKSTSEEAALAA